MCVKIFVMLGKRFLTISIPLLLMAGCSQTQRYYETASIESFLSVGPYCSYVFLSNGRTEQIPRQEPFLINELKVEFFTEVSYEELVANWGELPKTGTRAVIISNGPRITKYGQVHELLLLADGHSCTITAGRYEYWEAHTEQRYYCLDQSVGERILQLAEGAFAQATSPEESGF